MHVQPHHNPKHQQKGGEHAVKLYRLHEVKFYDFKGRHWCWPCGPLSDGGHFTAQQQEQHLIILSYRGCVTSLSMPIQRSLYLLHLLYWYEPSRHVSSLQGSSNVQIMTFCKNTELETLFKENTNSTIPMHTGCMIMDWSRHGDMKHWACWLVEGILILFCYFVITLLFQGDSKWTSR